MSYTHPTVQTALVASGGTTSQALRASDGMVFGIITPSALTSVAITFTGCDTKGGTFVPVYDADGNQVSLTAAPSRAIGLSGAEADALAPWPYIKLVCGSAEAADRSITVIVR